MSLDELNRAISIVKESDSIDFARQTVAEFLTRAKNILPDSLPKSVRNSFIEIADFIGNRDY